MGVSFMFLNAAIDPGGEREGGKRFGDYCIGTIGSNQYPLLHYLICFPSVATKGKQRDMMVVIERESLSGSLIVL